MVSAAVLFSPAQARPALGRPGRTAIALSRGAGFTVPGNVASWFLPVVMCAPVLGSERRATAERLVMVVGARLTFCAATVHLCRICNLVLAKLLVNI
jgi:hypothetical protein